MWKVRISVVRDLVLCVGDLYRHARAIRPNRGCGMQPPAAVPSMQCAYYVGDRQGQNRVFSITTCRFSVILFDTPHYGFEGGHDENEVGVDMEETGNKRVDSELRHKTETWAKQGACEVKVLSIEGITP